MYHNLLVFYLRRRLWQYIDINIDHTHLWLGHFGGIGIGYNI